MFPDTDSWLATDKLIDFFTEVNGSDDTDT